MDGDAAAAANRSGDRVPATVDTPFCVYSASKAITAFVVHKLAERGLLRLADPVADYIPGYERNRKHRITIGQVLAHRAGVPNLPNHALDLNKLGDREFMTEILAGAAPFAKPGRYLAYHAVSGGFILGEIVHAVTGKTIREVLAEEFLDLLGFQWTNYGVAADDVAKVHPSRARSAFTPGTRSVAGIPDQVFLRAHAGCPRRVPVRTRHPICARALGFHQHPGVCRSATSNLGRGPQQRKADRLSGTSAVVPGEDAAHHQRDSEDSVSEMLV